MTTNPPASGIHGRYRTLDTPGPNGWNDHGDPTHQRRQGNTPGPLGDDDHGTPLAGRLPLISNERDAEVARLIDETIARANAAAGPRDIAARLQSCLAAVGQAHAAGDLQDPKLRYAECYFAARRLTVEGKASIAPDDHPDAPPDAALEIGRRRIPKARRILQAAGAGGAEHTLGSRQPRLPAHWTAAAASGGRARPIELLDRERPYRRIARPRRGRRRSAPVFDHQHHRSIAAAARCSPATAHCSAWSLGAAKNTRICDRGAPCRPPHRPPQPRPGGQRAATPGAISALVQCWGRQRGADRRPSYTNGPAG